MGDLQLDVVSMSIAAEIAVGLKESHLVLAREAIRR